MKFRSLSNLALESTFEKVLFDGLSPDGTLYYPVRFPEPSAELLASETVSELATTYLYDLLGDEITYNDLKAISQKVMNFELPIVPVGDFKVLELFHGPTMAFKDIGARFLAQFMSYFIRNNPEQTEKTIFVATSGDTGGAVANAFSDVEGINVVILFPKGRVSQLQRLQLTRVGSNVISIEVDGFFDDCQSFVKKAFSDKEITQKLSLSTANSINISRLLPQMLFYIWSYQQLATDKINFIVPSGNFGNLTAGLFSKKYVIKNAKFVVANNANHPFFDYLKTGKYEPKQTIETISNAMDIGNPSNTERVFELYHRNLDLIKNDISASVISDKQTIETINQVYDEHGYLLDPHTAVAWHAAELAQRPDYENVVVSTAAPEKFAQIIKHRTGIDVDDDAASRPFKKAKDMSL